MDTLFEGVTSVMEVMETYGAGDLVNANRVFERLEALVAEPGRVDLVISELLLEYGIDRFNNVPPALERTGTVHQPAAPVENRPGAANGADAGARTAAGAERNDNPASDVSMDEGNQPINQLTTVSNDSLEEIHHPTNNGSTIDSQGSMDESTHYNQSIILSDESMDVSNQIIPEDTSTSCKERAIPTTSSSGVSKQSIPALAVAGPSGFTSHQTVPHSKDSDSAGVISSQTLELSPNLAKAFDEDMAMPVIAGVVSLSPKNKPGCSSYTNDDKEVARLQTGAIRKEFDSARRSYRQTISSDTDSSPERNGSISVIYESPPRSKSRNSLSDVDGRSSGKRSFSPTHSPRKKTRISPPSLNRPSNNVAITPEVLDLTSTSSRLGNVPTNVQNLCDIFPDADPQYLWEQCEKLEDEAAYGVLVDRMLSSGYPRVVNSNFTGLDIATEASAASRDNQAPLSKASTATATAHQTALSTGIASSPKSASTSTAVGIHISGSCAVSISISGTTSTATPSTSNVTVKSEVKVATASSAASASASSGRWDMDPLVPSRGAITNDDDLHNGDLKNLKLEDSKTRLPETKTGLTKGRTEVVEVESFDEVKKRLSLSQDGAVPGPSGLSKPASEPVVEVPREPWQDQYDNFVSILPEADPSFLEEKARALYDKENELREFVANALEKKDYPSRKDWQWRQEQLALQKKYTEEFSIENFLEIIPDPFAYFGEGKRKCCKELGTMYLRNKYRKLKVTDINAAFTQNNYCLTLTCRFLDNWQGPMMKSRRNPMEYDITKKDGGKGIDLPFLQEVAFLENESRIVKYLDDKKKRRQETFELAKARGELLECQCCFDDEVLSEDIRTCTEGHTFCVECVQKGAESRIGENHTTFPCLGECTAEFKLQVLQEVLKPTVFSRLMQRKQAEEVKAAGIEDLVQCPFCDFCNIPPKEDKVFRCLNPNCMKESCRLCKEDSHIPLRCDEVEKASEVKMRTYIEDKMTEALVRTCWKCSRKFVKEDGCNKMTCQCGALMCYVCRQPVKDYSHFNGQGGDAYDRCPLYSDHHALEVEEVRKMADQAKREVQAQKPDVKLKHDPTSNLPVHKPPSKRDRYDDYDSDDNDYYSDDAFSNDEDGYYDDYHHDHYRNRRYHYEEEEEQEEEAEEEEEDVEDSDSSDEDVDEHEGLH